MLNWQSKHKAECREILRLKEIVPEKEVHEGCPGKEDENELRKTDDERNSSEVTELTRTLANNGIRHEDDKSIARQPRKTKQNEDVVTFNRQRLSSLECRHDASRCSQCGKSDGNLKRCSRCKTAVYCSRDCQTTNWQSKHKTECREILQLKEIVPKEEVHGGCPGKEERQELTAAIFGKQWTHPLDIYFVRMCMYRDKQLICWVDQKQNCSFVNVCNSEGILEAEHRTPSFEFIKGMCMVHIGGKPFIAASIMTRKLFQLSDRIELWSYPFSFKPLHVYKSEINSFNVLHYFDGHLLTNDDNKLQINEYSISTKCIKPTGRSIPTGVVVCAINGIVQNGEKRLVIQNVDDRGLNSIRCINYRGQQLWRLGGHNGPKIDGSMLLPNDICADSKGNLFLADPDSYRIIHVDSALKPKTLHTVPGRAVCVAWDTERNKLYCLHMDFKCFKHVTTVLNITYLQRNS